MNFFKKLFSGSKSESSHSMSQERVEEIIQLYGAVMEVNAATTGIAKDSSTLPFPKQDIKQAIIIGMKLIDDPQMKDMLKIGYIQLADWQDGVNSINNNWTQMVRDEAESLKQELISLGLW
ncbi:MAG: hypothetical protein U5J62_08365 [Desulfurivibrio sp.]|nr:hypothetical protein [Desulfurivibrio sp.]